MESASLESLLLRLERFGQDLSPSERQNWQFMLAEYASRLSADRLPLADSDDTNVVWAALNRVITELYPSGVFPLPSLRDLGIDVEALAAAARREIPNVIRRDTLLVDDRPPPWSEGLGARLGDAVCHASGMDLRPSGVETAFYYLQSGHRLVPHVDPDATSAAVALYNLEHNRSVSSPGSALVTYDRFGHPCRSLLEPGQGLLLLASGTLHGREPVGANETIINLSIGFHRVGDAPEQPSI